MNKSSLHFSTTVMMAKVAVLLFLLAACTPREALVEDRQDARVGKVQPSGSLLPPGDAGKQSPTPTATATAVSTATPASTPVPPARITIQQPPTATAVPTVTVTASPTPVPSPTTEPDRSCPEIVPLKPEYDRFFLSAEAWPIPNPSLERTHFWLAKPLPGAGRVLTNTRFPYGWDENARLLLHNGVDIAEKLGTPVLAVADGTIRVAQADFSAWYGWRCDWYGHLVVLELDERWQDQPVYALYGHVLNLKVEPGQRVSRGEEVAEVGFGGAATNPHLHFELRVGENQFDATRNPMLWIDPGTTRGVIAGRLVDPQGRPWQGVPLAMVSRDDGERYSTWSYLGDPQGLANPDEALAENFVYSDVKPGQYDIYTSIQGVDYRQAVTVSAGEVTAVEIVTEPLRELSEPAPATTSTIEADQESSGG